MAEAVARAAGFAQVDVAEPNFVVRTSATANDLHYSAGSLWGMYGDATSPANAFGSEAGELWEAGHTGSPGVFVAVVDTGIDISHPDLAANIWTNPFDPIDGIDNDGNGYVDDLHGWDFANGDNSVYDGMPGDLSLDGHGTHVAGTIGARGGNGIGVAGMNWQVTIIPAKFLGAGGSGTVANAVRAINYVIDLKARHGLHIVAANNSWGGAGYSTSLHQAFIRAAKRDILMVVAAGNRAADNDTSAYYPANLTTNVTVGTETAAAFDAVITVAALTSTGALASYSSFGASSVEVGAPGSAVLSTTPQETYSYYSGTSMATPHVTGAIALFTSINPAWSAEAVRGAVMWRGTPTPSLSTVTSTGRRLTVSGFVVEAASSPPVSFSKSSPGDDGLAPLAAVLSWQPTPGAAGYEYCVDSIDNNVCDEPWTPAGSSTSAAVPLQAATPYVWQVRAFNSAGVTVADGGRWWRITTPGIAAYSAALRAPQCAGVGTFCDSGWLLRGRAAIVSGAEPHAPNTLQDSCGDGTFGTYHVDESVDRLRVTSVDGKRLAPGRQVRIDASVWIYSRIYNSLDLYYSASAEAPGWVFLGTVVPTRVGAATLSALYTLPAGAVQAVRARLRLVGSAASACVPGSYNDHDDLVFATQPAGFTDDVLSSGLAPVRGIHLQELRTRINALRVGHGLPEAAWTDGVIVPGMTVIRATHLAELRAALAAVYQALGIPAPSYTDSVVTGGMLIRAIHVSELRSAVLAVE